MKDSKWYLCWGFEKIWWHPSPLYIVDCSCICVCILHTLIPHTSKDGEYRESMRGKEERMKKGEKAWGKNQSSIKDKYILLSFLILPNPAVPIWLHYWEKGFRFELQLRMSTLTWAPGNLIVFMYYIREFTYIHFRFSSSYWLTVSSSLF